MVQTLNSTSAENGTSTAPSISFASSPTSGLYMAGTNILGIVGSAGIRINSVNTTNATGTSIGFQSKIAQNAAGDSVTGAEISPRLNSGVAITGTIIGLHVDAYLKGTAVGTVGGDVRGLNVELVTEDAGTRTVTGNVSMIRLRSAFSATTITGKFVAMRIEKPETQTNSKTFDAVFELPSTLAGVWSDTETSTTGAGFIKVLVNGNARYITLTSGEPS